MSNGESAPVVPLSWPDFLKRISLRPSFPLSLELRESTRGRGLVLFAKLDAPDIHTGQMQTLHIAEVLMYPPHDEKHALWIVRTLLRAALEHELDECLLLDGVQVRDPHSNERSSLTPTPDPDSITLSRSGR
jgi:hypothetical protein